MNINTGEIIDNVEYMRLLKKDNFVEIDSDEMTNKQKEKKQVSLKDHTSRLGKKLTNIRSIKGLTKNQLRNLKKKGFIR